MSSFNIGITLIILVIGLGIAGYLLFSSGVVINRHIIESTERFMLLNQGLEKSYFYFYDISYYNSSIPGINPGINSSASEEKAIISIGNISSRPCTNQSCIKNKTLQAKATEKQTRNNTAKEPECKNKERIIVRVAFNLSQMPDNCDLFVDGSLEKELRMQPLFCKECNRELIENIATRKKLTSKSHIIKLCCDQICIAAKLKKLCKAKTQANSSS